MRMRFAVAVIVLALAIVAVFASMALRMARPVPAADLMAIRSFLSDRDQTLVEVRKLWVGGPPQYGARFYAQVGRPYRVLARSGDGAEWSHDLAAMRGSAAGGAPLMEKRFGVWARVLQ